MPLASAVRALRSSRALSSARALAACLLVALLRIPFASAVPWSSAVPAPTVTFLFSGCPFPLPQTVTVDSCCVIDASGRNIDSLQPADVQSLLGSGPDQCQANFVVLDLSGNAFTNATTSNFFAAGNPVFVAGDQTLPEWQVDLSDNPLGPVFPSTFSNANLRKGFVCRRCGITSIPPDSLSAANIGRVLDLSENDLSVGLFPRSFAGVWVSAASPTGIALYLRNCNLRGSSLAQAAPGLFYSAVQHPLRNPVPIRLYLDNDPLATDEARDLTPESFLARNPNIFADFPSNFFVNMPNRAWSYLALGRVIIGEFVSTLNGAPMFQNMNFAYGGDIMFTDLQLASRVTARALGYGDGLAHEFCPLASFLRAMIERGASSVASFLEAGVTLTASGFGLPAPDPAAQGLCALPNCGPNNADGACFLAPFARIVVPTEPAFLCRSFTRTLNLAGFRQPTLATALAWMPPSYGVWNPSLNRSDWVAQDLLCDLGVQELVLPALPWDGTGVGTQFPFPPPSAMLACLSPVRLKSIDWTLAHTFSSGMFQGVRVNENTGLEIALSTKYLYRGEEPVPLDFFSPLLSGRFFEPPPPQSPPDFPAGPDCDDSVCPQAAQWITSGCPRIVRGACVPCDAGSFDAQWLDFHFCASCSAGFFCPLAAGANSSVAIPCLPGSYQASPGKSSCDLCSVGTFNPLSGASTPAACVQCAPGTANAVPGGASRDESCLPCAEGKASYAPGVAHCPDCPAGRWSNSTSSFECTACPANTYSPRSGATSLSECVRCPPNAPLAPEGSASVLACSIGIICDGGRYTLPSDPEPCASPCPRGKFCVGGLVAPCPAGSYADQPGSASCVPCGGGMYSAPPSSATGATSRAACKPCPRATYSNLDVSESCTPCAAGTSSVVGSASNSSCAPLPSVSSCAPGGESVCLLASSSPVPLGSLLVEGVGLVRGIQALPSLLVSPALAGNETTGDVYTPTAAEITKSYRSYLPSRSSASLRLAAFGSDGTLASSDALGPSDGRNVGPSIPAPSGLEQESTMVAVIVSFLLLGLLAIPLYRFIPARVALYCDLLASEHHIHAGESLVRLPTQLGTAFTWTFCWCAILIAIFLGAASNTALSTALVPASSIPYAGSAKANMQFTLRAYSSEDSVASYCADAASIVASQEGFSAAASIKSKPQGPACSVATDCNDCSLSSGSSAIAFQFPFDVQLIEWEVWISAAAPGTWSRRYGVITQLPDLLLDQEAELSFSAIESYHVDRSRFGDSKQRTGFELDFLQYTSLQPQPVSTYNGQSTVQLSFRLAKSDIMFDSLLSNKLSALQIVVSIFTAVVSLYSLFSLLFRKTELWAWKRAFGWESGEIALRPDGTLTIGKAKPDVPRRNRLSVLADDASWEVYRPPVSVPRVALAAHPTVAAPTLASPSAAGVSSEEKEEKAEENVSLAMEMTQL